MMRASPHRKSPAPRRPVISPAALPNYADLDVPRVRDSESEVARLGERVLQRIDTLPCPRGMWSVPLQLAWGQSLCVRVYGWEA